MQLDAASDDNLRNLIGSGFDVVIDLLPPIFVGKVAEICVEQKVSLVNTFYAIPEIKALKEASMAKGVTILPEFGMDPGIDLVLLGEAVRSLDEVTEVMSYGADYKSIVECPSSKVLNNMITTARMLEQEGVREITTSCGFNAYFQQELAAAVNIPVFTSSLMQIPMIYQALKPDQAIGVITADKQHLTKAHFINSGIPDNIPIKVASISHVSEFAKLRDNPQAILNPDLFINQIVAVTEKLVRQNPFIGAIVLECTDLPPSSSAIRKATGLAVFDIVTLVNLVYNAIV